MLPFNTGGGGYNGHRIYAAMPYLVDADFVAFLDEDNAFCQNHIESLMDRVERCGLMWAHSLRQVVDIDGKHILNDDCESLGRWTPWNNDCANLVDLNCYLLRRDIALSMAPILHRRYPDEDPPDYELCRQLLRHAPRFQCTGLYSVLYTVGRSRWSVSRSFFEKGNAIMKKRYPNGFPWAS
jgi:hypothetical protein